MHIWTGKAGKRKLMAERIVYVNSSNSQTVFLTLKPSSLNLP